MNQHWLEKLNILILLNLTNINCNTLITPAFHHIQGNTSSIVDQFHQKNVPSGRDLGTIFSYESNSLIKKQTRQNFHRLKNN